MTGADERRIVPLPAVPVRYAFLSVHRIVGFSSLPAGQSLPIDLGLEGVTASLVADPNPALIEIDRWSALAVLLMSAFVGKTEGPDILSLVEEKVRDAVSARTKAHNVPGVFLVLRIEGEVHSQPTGVSRDLGMAVLASEAVDKEAIKARHAGLASAVLTAASLTVGQTSPDLVKVAEAVELMLIDGRPLYSMTFAAGAATVSTARMPSVTDCRRLADLTNGLLANEQLTAPARLLVDALRNSDARLEGFILAWAALEMFVRKQTRGLESGDWLQAVPPPTRAAATAVHQAFLDGGHSSYSLGARVRALGLLYGLDDWERLAGQVNTLRKQYREPLYHEGRFKESELPLDQIIGIARRLMAVVLAGAKSASRASE